MSRSVEPSAELSPHPCARIRCRGALLPALHFEPVVLPAGAARTAAAEAMLAERELRRRFAYDTLVLAADGAISAVFWTFEPGDPGPGAPAGLRRSS